MRSQTPSRELGEIPAFHDMALPTYLEVAGPTHSSKLLFKDYVLLAPRD
jgi:hypothetical protein